MSSYNYPYGGAVNATSPTTANGGPRDRVTRILVVGETRVGKTLLIRRLCDHIFGDTSIERNVDDYSPFNTAAATATTAADDDDLGPEWGPTVGIAVDALKRTTTVLSTSANGNDLSMPSLYPPGPAMASSSSYAPESSGAVGGGGGGGYSAYGGLQYRGSGPAGGPRAEGGGALNASMSHLPSNRPFQPAPLQHRCSVTQTVEFHELGGTHGYRDIARLPLQNIAYDGVIFVYHRRNLTSTVYLAEWYHWVRSVLSVSASVSGPSNPHNSSNRFRTMPRFMLVGTQLDGDERTAAAAGLQKDLDSLLHIGTVAVADEALLEGNVAMKVRAMESPQTPTRRGRVKPLLRALRRSLVWPYHVLWSLWHPFFFLTEQYQEERGPRGKVVGMCTRLVERCTWLLYKVEQLVLYLMAVVLFGPYQEFVVLGQSGTKQTLEELRKDEQCVAQAHVCRLDSDIALQSSLDEIVAFFDILLREN